jgi:uncharacterized membrane protein YhaH (DUF805 family)
MFKFNGHIGRKQFFRASALRIGLFMAFVLSFPYFITALDAVNGCKGICGNIGAFDTAKLMPLARVLFVFSLVGVSMRRARDAGVPGWIGLFVPLLLAVDYDFLVSIGGLARAHSLPVPYYSLLALVCTAFLCAVPSRRDGHESRNPFGYLGLAAFGLGLVVTAYGVLTSRAFGISALIGMNRPLFIESAKLLPYAIVGLVALLAWIAWRARSHTATGQAASVPEPAAASDIAIKGLLALALVLTIASYSVAIPDELRMHALMTLLASETNIVPTFLLYFCLLLSVFLAIKWRTAKSVVLLALALLPFAHWAYAHWTVMKEHEATAAEIAAVPTARAPRVPTTIVVESRSMEGLNAVWAINGIERAILRGAYGARLVQFDRGSNFAPGASPREVGLLPDEYLLLKVGPASRFATVRRQYTAAGGPLELRFVDSQRDELVAVWYRVFNPPPAFLPMLTTGGWYRWSNNAAAGEFVANIRTFLTRSLASG